MDEIMVRSAARGDRRAAHAVLARLLPRVRVLVRYLVGAGSDADDMIQDSLVEILRSLKSFQGKAALETWADRVTSRCVFAALKKRGKQPVSSMHLVDAAKATGASPEEQETRRQWLRTLEEIPQEQRHVLVLHHVAETTVEEISEAICVPHETVRTRLRRGKDRLRAVWEEQEGGRDERRTGRQ